MQDFRNNWLTSPGPRNAGQTLNKILATQTSSEALKDTKPVPSSIDFNLGLPGSGSWDASLYLFSAAHQCGTSQQQFSRSSWHILR